MQKKAVRSKNLCIIANVDIGNLLVKEVKIQTFSNFPEMFLMLTKSSVWSKKLEENKLLQMFLRSPGITEDFMQYS